MQRRSNDDARRALVYPCPVTLDLEVLRANVAAARAAIDEAAARAGRPAGTVELLAATKYVSADDMPLLAEAGIALVGENRTDALAAKQALHLDLFTWDFIGALQSRKARDVVDRVRLVHAVETLSAAEQLARRAERDVACLIEVGVAGEEQKAGVAPDEVIAFLEACVPLERLQVEGLMTMPPLAADPETSRRHFAALRELASSLEDRFAGRFTFERLSMGTSQDFAVAVEEGATIVRLGSVLYGRPAG
jgi:pyridoxal phosphate enzyme (YggS family)